MFDSVLKFWQAHCIDHLVIPTRDYCFAPSLGDICRAVDFICGKRYMQFDGIFESELCFPSLSLQDGCLCMYNIWVDCFVPLHAAVLVRIFWMASQKLNFQFEGSLYDDFLSVCFGICFTENYAFWNWGINIYWRSFIFSFIS